MKTLKIHKLLAVWTLVLFTVNSAYAQYPPGQNLPSLSDITLYNWNRSNRGIIQFIGEQPTATDHNLYSIMSKFQGNELFRVSANGTTSILGNVDDPPALNFYTSNRFYLGSIGFPREEMNISALYGIRLNPKGKNKVFITESQTNIFNPLHLSLKGVYSDEGITFKIGRNGDPIIASNIEKWLRIGGRNGLALWGNNEVNNDDEPTVLLKGGVVTIGQVESPGYKLNVGGSLYLERAGIKVYVGRDISDTNAWIGTESNHGMFLGINKQMCMYFDADYRNGYIWLETTDIRNIRQELKSKYTLFVGRGVLSEDYAIAPKSTWADFVFSSDYALRTIAEVEEFVSENHHLPDVPSAKQVAEEGYSQHEMNKVLLQKIEELTLYTIQQQKEIEGLKSELNKSKGKSKK